MYKITLLVPICLILLSFGARGQSSPPFGGEPHPDDDIIFRKEPYPLNLDSIVQAFVYPPIAKEAGIEGRIIFRILIDTSGHYLRHIVLREPHSILTKAVETQLPALRFSPAFIGPHPVKAWVSMPFNCILPED